MPLQMEKSRGNSVGKNLSKEYRVTSRGKTVIGEGPTLKEEKN